MTGAREGSLSRGGQLLEVVVFLFLIIPSMALSYFTIRQGALTFALTAFATILRDLALLAVVVYFLWRNGEPLARIGWTFRDGFREIFLGVWLFILLFIGAGLLEQLFRRMGLSAPSTPLPRYLTAHGVQELVLASLLAVVVAVCEESIFRGYLILRFRNVSGSMPAAVLFSSLIFALGHGYEGSAGVATVGVMGLAFALVYIWRKSLTAPIVMHFLQDFVGIVIVPLLTGK